MGDPPKPLGEIAREHNRNINDRSADIETVIIEALGETDPVKTNLAWARILELNREIRLSSQQVEEIHADDIRRKRRRKGNGES